MIRGIYTGASGMLAKWTEMDVISNNLANVDTPAFKKHLMLWKEEPRFKMHRLFDNLIETPGGEFDIRPYIGDMGTGVRVKGEFIDFSPGALKSTGNPLDLAIIGDGFFEVERAGQGKFYTRAGNFIRNAEGLLTTLHGDKVLGVDGNPIRINVEGLYIQKNGSLVDREGIALGQIRLVAFDPKQLQSLSKVGDNFFAKTQKSGDPVPAPASTELRQGFLEVSNSNIVKDMVQMIVVNRAYEANQRVISSHDQLLGQAVNEVSRA